MKTSKRTKTYRATVVKDDNWYVAEVTGLRAFDGGKGGVVTQGRDLDELAFMVRDAIALMTDETDFAIELLLPATLKVAAVRSTARASKKPRRAAA